jgi:hypothetical protein
MRVNSNDVNERFSDLILINHFCVAVFGVVRRDVLAKTPLISKFVGSDRVLLAELGLRGRLCEIPEYLFHRRDHPQTSGRMFNMYKRLSWFDPSKRRNINLVYWTVGFEYIKAIKRVHLPWSKRVSCYKTIIRWFIHRRRWLLQDIKAAILQIAPFTRYLVQFARKLQGKHINTGGGI